MVGPCFKQTVVSIDGSTVQGQTTRTNGDSMDAQEYAMSGLEAKEQQDAAAHWEALDCLTCYSFPNLCGRPTHPCPDGDLARARESVTRSRDRCYATGEHAYAPVCSGNPNIHPDCCYPDKETP